MQKYIKIFISDSTPFLSTMASHCLVALQTQWKKRRPDSSKMFRCVFTWRLFLKRAFLRACFFRELLVYDFFSYKRIFWGVTFNLTRSWYFPNKFFWKQYNYLTFSCIKLCHNIEYFKRSRRKRNIYLAFWYWMDLYTKFLW